MSCVSWVDDDDQLIILLNELCCKENYFYGPGFCAAIGLFWRRTLVQNIFTVLCLGCSINFLNQTKF